MSRPARPRISDSDIVAMRAAALVRVAVASLATGVGLVGAGGWERPMGTFFLLVGALWLPWTLLLLVAGMARPGRRRRLQLALYGGPVGDVAVLFAAQCLLAPWAWGILMLANALAVSVAAWMWRSRRSWMLLGSAVALTVTAQSIVPAGDRQPAGLLAVFALAMVGLTLVVGRIARNHRVAAVTSHHFRQKAETILARVADGIVVTDGDGIVLETNPAGERLMGAEGPFVVGMPCVRALGLHEGERRLDCQTSCPLLHDGPAGEPGPGREVWREISDGRRQPLLASAFAVTDEQGGVEIVHSLRDITRLKEADEAKTLFLATASHELKTPVTVIAGFAETILAYPDMPPERRAQAVEAIRRRATELSAIVDRLLLSSKIESGRVHVDVHPVDVRAVVIERSTAFQDASGRHIVRLVADEGLVAMADPLALQTVVDHLLDNAVKYSDGGPVVIRGRRHEGAVEVSVSDIGIGMDEEQARRCFDKFWQAESTDVRRFGGTGIGLYIVSSLVDAMGGVISVETAVGRGCTFTVTLPVVEAPEAAAVPADQPGIKDVRRQVGALSRGNA